MLSRKGNTSFHEQQKPQYEWEGKKVNCFASSTRSALATNSSHNHKFKLMQISLLLYQLCVLCYFFYVYSHWNLHSHFFLCCLVFILLLLYQHSAIIRNPVKTLIPFSLFGKPMSGGEWTMSLLFCGLNSTNTDNSQVKIIIESAKRHFFSSHFTLLSIHVLRLHLIKRGEKKIFSNIHGHNHNKNEWPNK